VIFPNRLEIPARYILFDLLSPNISLLSRFCQINGPNSHETARIIPLDCKESAYHKIRDLSR
jgi:hypothetical protein